MIGKISLILFYWVAVLALTLPIAVEPLQEAWKLLVGLVVIGAVLAWLEKPWQMGYDFYSNRMRPVLMFASLGTALIVAIGLCSWQFIFWLN